MYCGGGGWVGAVCLEVGLTARGLSNVLKALKSDLDACDSLVGGGAAAGLGLGDLWPGRWRMLMLSEKMSSVPAILAISSSNSVGGRVGAAEASGLVFVDLVPERV